MQSVLNNLPKAELHLHLEGSVEPETLSELAPDLTPALIRERYRYKDFAGFIESFKWATSYVRTPRDYALITRRLLARLEEQNVRYAEITVSAGMICLRRQDFPGIFDAIRDEARASSVKVRWILDSVRQYGAREAMRIAELAAARIDQGVVGFGIGGDESLGPVHWFGEVFSYARRKGLHLTIHAGETVGPESIWGAIHLGAERIGHGIAAIKDPKLMTYLKDHDIPLEVCVTSNVCTGAVRSLEQHPLRALYDAGVPIVLNTDDPALFQTNLTAEYELAARRFGFTLQELEALAANGFRYAFALNS